MPRSRRCRLALVVCALLPLAVGACAAHPASGARPGHDCVSAFHAGTDYFPDKSEVLDAGNFTLSYHDSYQVLTVKQPYPHGRPQSYVLVRCGTPTPALTGDLAGAQPITVPVATLYSASITQLGMLAELDRTDLVTGVGVTADVVDPRLRRQIGRGATVGYAPGGQIDTEAVVAAHPDVLVSGGIDEPEYPKLRDAGVPVLADAEWLEATPLGRAEWIKVLAALTGTERQAAEVYRGLRGAYTAVAAKAVGVRPVEVLPGAMYQGTWSMPAGGDYAGRLILDAGGHYPWAGDTSSGSLQLNFESVYAASGQSPVWLVTDDWRTTGDALAADRRYGELAAVRRGQVWSATKAGNDYWERGPARPDLLLGDLVAILHPELAPHHEFSFYRQVARR